MTSEMNACCAEARAPYDRLTADLRALAEEHGPAKCVPVAEANRVLAEERARLEGALARAVAAVEGAKA